MYQYFLLVFDKTRNQIVGISWFLGILRTNWTVTILRFLWKTGSICGSVFLVDNLELYDSQRKQRNSGSRHSSYQFINFLINASLWMTNLYAALFCSSSQTDTEMQEHMGPPVFKLVARNSRKNSPFFKNDSNAPQSPLRGTPKQEPRDREGERTYQRLSKN